MLETLDAELSILRGDGRLILARHRHERREIHPLAGEILGELEANARRGCVRVDTVVQQSEAMVLTDAFVLLAHLGHFAQFKRGAQRVQCRTPYRTVGVGARDDDQALGFLPAVTRTLVGDVGSGRCAFEQRRAFAVVARPYLQHGFGKTQPVCAVVGRHRHDLPQDLHARAKIVALEGGISLAPQRRRGLADLTGLSLDLGFELDGGVGEIVALEGLVGGKGWGG